MLKWVLLESPLALGILSSLVLFTLLVYRAQTGNQRPALVGIVVMGILFAIQMAITTNREQVRLILDGVVGDVLKGVTTNLRASLSDSFEINGLDADEFCDLVDQRYKIVRPIYVREVALEVDDSQEGVLKARVSYWHDVRLVKQGMNATTNSHWLLELIESDSGWKINRITPDGPFHGWSEVWGFR